MTLEKCKTIDKSDSFNFIYSLVYGAAEQLMKEAHQRITKENDFTSIVEECSGRGAMLCFNAVGDVIAKQIYVYFKCLFQV